MTLSSLLFSVCARAGCGGSGGVLHEPQGIVPPGVALLVLECNLRLPGLLSF